MSDLEERVHPEFVFHPIRAPISGAYMGHAGMEDFLADNESMFEYFRAEFDELDPLPDGRLLAIGHIRMRARDGAVETEVRTAGIAAFRHGRMSSWRDYGDEAV